MTKSVYLVCGLLAALLVSPNDGAAKTAETPEANAEVTDNASVQTPSHAPEEALTRLSALAPPPQLSERALGIHTASCLRHVQFCGPGPGRIEASPQLPGQWQGERSQHSCTPGEMRC
jgi:hypothetical protein